MVGGSTFGFAVMALGLDISDKSVVVSNDPTASKFVANELRALGFPVSHSTSAERLGVRFQMGQFRDDCIANSRWARFKARMNRVSLLS